MYGIKDLEESNKVNDSFVKCPVKGCSEYAKRQRNHFSRDEAFKCPKHDIYISPSTFEYENELSNLLWHEANDQELLKNIMMVKRESRMARDNSEDAVSWNVFRFLEQNGLIGTVFERFLDGPIMFPEIIYWSYNQKENSSWSLLDKARKEFGERLDRSSEPDIIIQSENALLFIEAKLSANNETFPSDLNNPKSYASGGNGWFPKVFRSDYQTVAIQAKKYELMRFWLLGTWMAEQLDLHFYLINLVRAGFEENIEEVFGKHIKQHEQRIFKRLTWEDLYKAIQETAQPSEATELTLDYFRDKTLGYERNGNLLKAFKI